MKPLKVPVLPLPASLALLALRLVAGAAFMLHGWPKIQRPFAWMGSDAAAPGFFQGLAALSEFGGGLAWIPGLLTPIASAGIACTMCVAAWTHVLLIAAGPGRLSLDRRFFGER